MVDISRTPIHGALGFVDDPADSRTGQDGDVARVGGVLCAWSGGAWTPIFSGAAATPTVYTRTSDFIKSELIPYEFLEVQHPVTATRHQVIVDIAHGVAGAAAVNWYLFWAQHATPGTTLFDASLDPIAGATRVFLGGVSYDTQIGNVMAVIELSGLTFPGNDLTIQIAPAIVGGYQAFRSVDGPNGMCTTPNGRYLFITKFNSGCVQPVMMNPNAFSDILMEGYQDTPMPSVPTGQWANRCACTNTILVVANLLSSTLSIVNIDMDNIAFPFKIRDSGTITNAQDVVINAAGTTAYVTELTGKVYPVTISTGVVGTGVQAGAVTDSMLGIALNAAETKLVVGNFTTAGLKVITLPNTVASIATAGRVVAVHRAPVTDKIWALLDVGPGTSSRLVSLNSGLTAIDDSFTLHASSLTPKDFAIGTSGESAWVGLNGRAQEVILEGEFKGTWPAGHQGTLPLLSGATYTGPITGIAINNLDEIYYAFNTSDEVGKSPGSRIAFLYSNAFYAHRGWVIVR